jgi:hypothetical protein
LVNFLTLEHQNSSLRDKEAIMFGTEIIEVGIGLAFAYFAISIICSGIVEAGVKLSNLRSKHLKSALGELLDDKNYNGFVRELYDHHLIATPLKTRLGDPTFISSRNFALAVLDILGKSETNLSESEQMKLIEQRLLTIKDPTIRQRMLAMLKSSAYQVDSMREKIESWFNDSMDAATEWYRQRMRLWVSVVSVIVVGAMNADTIKMTSMFWNDDELRSATVKAAEGYVNTYDARVAAGTAANLNTMSLVVTRDSNGNAIDSHLVSTPTPAATDTNVVRSIKSQLDTLYADINATKVLPIGWGSEILPGRPGFNSNNSPLTWWALKLIGLILTVGAVSLGSTYWYKQLKALLSLRLGRGDAAAAPPAAAPTTTPAPPIPSPQRPAAQPLDAAPTDALATDATEIDPSLAGGGSDAPPEPPQ